MTVSRPEQYRDKFQDWYAYWNEERRKALVKLMTDEVIEEHRANPTGYRKFHSPALQEILNYMHTQPVLGKYYIYTARDWQDYRIARIEPLGQGVRLIGDQSYDTEEEAMHGVFLLRVKDIRDSVAGD